MEEPRRLRGRVRFFASHKGYGFIDMEKNGGSIFFHINDLGGLILGKGDVVEFGIGASGQGRVAIHVVRVEESTALSGRTGSRAGVEWIDDPGASS